MRPEPQQPELERQEPRRRQGGGRLGAIAAVVAGVAWLVLLSNPTIRIDGHPVDLRLPLFLIALMGMSGGLVGLHVRQAPHYGKLGTAGFLASFIGILLLIVSVAGFASDLGRGSDVLSRVIAVVAIFSLPLGFLGAFVGFVLLGLATQRARVLPEWCGFLLIINSVASGIALMFLVVTAGGFSIVGGTAGMGIAGVTSVLPLGLVWVGLGYALWPKRRVTGDPPRGAS